MVSDIEILKQLREKAKNRDLGVNSIYYYYALKHTINQLNNIEYSQFDAEIVRCKDCKHRDPEDKRCDCGGMPFDTQILPVPDDWFCANGEC